ncbi:hypothetical protein [Peredibacter starrii]|uniref:Uncharacterized protein n=1 Tax=Peredibacter starrii TaxID=28202 RepID=A0AAX4HJZ6_9BACT|nr:hypothetical protein [Peredibacter starrii]WPU63511.1 hypothetical protein SOO65_12510 [Peredibacter starrii]
MKKYLMMALLLMTASAYAQDSYEIIMFTDPDAKTRAEEFKQYLVQKPPFNKLGEKVKVTLVELSPEVMDCKNDVPDSPRIIHCNREELLRLKANAKAHLALAFTSKGTGGAGGVIPVASKDYPIQTMFHEMLHAYGFDDEYDYDENEKKVYCDKPTSSVNIAYFKDKPPYVDDSAARKIHAKDVPWMGKIPSENSIVTAGNLGSQFGRVINGTQTPGLYRGGSCNSDKTPAWRPYQNSIMKGYDDDTIYPIYEEVILKSIESAMGQKVDKKKKFEDPTPAPRCLQHNHEMEMLKGYDEEMKEITKHI